MSIAKPTIYPTLLIGIGGVGTNVARHTKKRFLRTWNASEMRDLPSVLQVMSVDTEPLVNSVGETPLYYHEFAFLGKYDATRLIDNKDQHKEIADWWQWGSDDLPLGYIHTGAKQLRPIGRLSFFRHYNVFKTRLIDKLNAMQENAAIKEAQERGFAVAPDYRLIYIVSSLCGGTGSGMFLDIAHRVRQEVGSNANIVGIFLLPSTFFKTIPSELQRQRIQANAYAALKELDHFHHKTDFSVLYPGEKVKMPTTRYRAFSQIFLIERTNADGRTLTTKAEVEQMVAHFISLNAFSHLNKRMLGLDVNVTEEHEHGMSYSSFGVSALVLPRTLLRQYFKARIVTEVLSRLLSQSGEDDAAQSDDQRIARKEDALVIDEIVKQFNSLTVNKKDCEDLEKHLRQGDGHWPKFTALIRKRRDALLKERGLNAAWYYLDFLRICEGEGFGKGSLAHGSTAPLAQEAPSVPSGFEQAFRTLTSRRAGRAGEERAVARELYEARKKTWELLVVEITTFANQEVAMLDSTIASTIEAIQDAWANVEQIGKRIQPLNSDGNSETATYYDLESGAISEDDLEGYWMTVHEELNRPFNGNLGAPSGADVLIDIVSAGLVDGTQALTDVNAAELQAWVEDAFDNDPSLANLRVADSEAYDLRSVVAMQFREPIRPANFRPDQTVQPTGPHATLDSDTRPHSAADEEHLRLLAMPEERGKDDHVDADGFEKGFDGYRNFDWVATGNGDRIDAVHVVHGLPVSHLRCIQDMKAIYDSWPKRSTLHLDKRWEKFDPIPKDPPVTAANGKDKGSETGKDDATATGSPQPASAAPAAAPSPFVSDVGPVGPTERP